MKFKRRKIKRGRIEIIPMIDTIVILLIFYMTFSQFAEANKLAKIKLPRAVAGEELKQKPGQVVINMMNKDEVYLSGTALKASELPPKLRHLKTLPEYADMSIILRASEEMTYADLSDFMKACAKAGIANVTFTTLEARASK
jgi:biopolymer transport protein ExbD